MTNLNDAMIGIARLAAAGRPDSDGCWLALSDYRSLSEVYAACEEYFGDRNLKFVFDAWQDIPDSLIRPNWICPEIFEIQDALRDFDDAQMDAFMRWCRRYGYDISTDDVPLLVEHFREMTGAGADGCCDLSEASDEELEYLTQDDLWLGLHRTSLDVFDDNYD